MSITDELREYAGNLGSLVYASTANVKRTLEEIADRIDEKHEDELTMERGRAITELGSDIALNYIQLPKDADGKPIHLGDELEWPDGNRLTVNGIGEGGTLFYVDAQGDVQWTASGDKRHVNPDSWERIIHDARTMEGCGSTEEFMTRHGAELVERCKRLAGEDA